MENRVISPMELEILLFYYYSPMAYHRDNVSSKAIQAALDFLINEGMLEETKREGAQRGYDVSGKGQFYIAYILATPFPVSRWEIPA